MRARPRYAENEVARVLSRFSSTLNYGPIERVPVIGRTGPDLSTNELGLVVDVKSRKAVPVSWIGIPGGLITDGDLIGMCIGNLDVFQHAPEVRTDVRLSSKLVRDWYEHMASWEKFPAEGIAALVLHRPGLAYAQATLVIKKESWRLFCDRGNFNSQLYAEHK